MSALLPWQRESWQRLQASRQRGALAHALLLCGPAGLGKRDFAARLVDGLLCQQPENGHACGHCRSCKLLPAGSHPDRVQLGLELRRDGSPRTEVVIEQIRRLSARLAMSSQFGGWQVAVIDPADAMNPSAANALLKTLEEPAAQTLLVLLANAPWRLPATIRSRCQRVEFQLPAANDALAWLTGQGVADAPAALAAAGGNPGLAQAWHASGTLAQRRDVRKDLAALSAGRGEPLEVTKRWLDDEPSQRLWFAAQAAADEARARQLQAPTLGSTLDEVGLMDWYAHANRARDALRGPLRVDLMLLELLAKWR